MNIHDTILKVFRSAGEPLSTRTLARRCIEEGVFPEDWQANALVRAAQEECRSVLKGCDIHGLPFAGKTSRSDDGGAPLWVQREMWDFETYALNIEEYLRQRDQNHEKALLLRNECQSRFGRTPEIPGLEGARGVEGAA